eukprot:gnl/TRDRNA2_/TRDRNA2_157465_c0_seq1.p1 gnl/TRDRNA2_/TRDRNA2_157465_c0~~gnl/TRDRNA2_/TRDRNA2_157465_c0_seq1.p1  ORF type:complete len:248 (-),score=45.86 gnl/TRDRNA2_/TRDRNA2_157465_c0_seq1:47-790(-)
MQYVLMNGSHLEPVLQPGEWVSEPILWTRWRHCGEFRAVEPSELVNLEPKAFTDIMSMHPKPWKLCKRYGEYFVNHLTNLSSQAYLSDVIRDYDFYKRLMYTATENAQLSKSLTSSMRFRSKMSMRRIGKSKMSRKDKHMLGKLFARINSKEDDLQRESQQSEGSLQTASSLPSAFSQQSAASQQSAGSPPTVPAAKEDPSIFKEIPAAQRETIAKFEAKFSLEDAMEEHRASTQVSEMRSSAVKQQ